MRCTITYPESVSFLRHTGIVVSSGLLAVTLVAMFPQPSYASIFAPVIDEFSVTQNGVTVLDDTFNNGVVPPEGPLGPNTYNVVGPGGMIKESSSGGLTMNPALGFQTQISSTISDTSTLASLPYALHQEDSFAVRALYNISLPNTLPSNGGQLFGIRLTDGDMTTASENTVDLMFQIGTQSGNMGVRLTDVNVFNNAVLKADFVSTQDVLSSAAYVELALAKDANSVNPTASFTVYDSGMNVLKSGGLDNVVDATGQMLSLFNGENYTHAVFQSFDHNVSVTPIPATLPLFASGAGLLGLLCWRRKRSKTTAFAA